MTERLWITQPRRRTSLARVTQVRRSAFALDRSLFAPTSHLHRHPQPADQGTVWEAGERRRLERVYVRDGVLWHEVRGRVPPVGVQLQCHLDQERRSLVSRAHTAMHLLLAAASRHPSPPLAADPTVKAGGIFRLDFTQPVAPTAVASWLAQANAWVALDARVATEHWPRGEEAKVLDAQAFEPPDPFPGPPTTLDAVRVEGVCAYPCDGTHAERTGQVGRIIVPQMARAGRAVVAKVTAIR